jgi:hypothetical protein
MSPYLEENMTKYIIFTLQVQAEGQIKAGRLKAFLFSNLTCSQIWLHLVVYDFVITNYITKLGGKKTHVETKCSMKFPKNKMDS